MKKLATLFLAVVCCVLLGATAFSQTSVRFGAVGDFNISANSQSVANLIGSWAPDFVITVGDNNYSNVGTIAGWDASVGVYYESYIKYPAGSTSIYATPSPATNNFYPSLGNHDWDATGYTNYFELPAGPGNERYYDYVRGPVHFFVVDSDPTREPDGITSSSVQGVWLKNALASSTAKWKIVSFHHPPYSSSTSHGSTPSLQWPFQAWGATAVLSGHDHTYERIVRNGFPYFVTGHGGNALYPFGTPVTGSVVRYNANHGAMLIEADASAITFKAYSITGGGSGTLIDTYTINATTAAYTATFDEMRAGQRIEQQTGYFHGGAGPSIRAENSLVFSQSLDSSANVFTWTGHQFDRPISEVPNVCFWRFISHTALR